MIIDLNQSMKLNLVFKSCHSPKILLQVTSRLPKYKNKMQEAKLLRYNNYWGSLNIFLFITEINVILDQ